VAVLRIRAPLACRIAGIDRDRFNEAVARGDYPCAPDAIAGQTRTFSIHDVVGLFVYGILVKDGTAAKQAGQIACEVSRLAKSAEGFEKEIAVTVVKTRLDRHFFFTAAGKLDDDRKAQIEKETRVAIISPNARAMTDSVVIRQENWQIGNIRKIIDDAIEDYRNTLGEEEAIG
jgi:vacuolar-type H+-ATPase subunit I/STV1